MSGNSSFLISQRPHSWWSEYGVYPTRRYMCYNICETLIENFVRPWIRIPCILVSFILERTLVWPIASDNNLGIIASFDSWDREASPTSILENTSISNAMRH